MTRARRPNWHGPALLLLALALQAPGAQAGLLAAGEAGRFTFTPQGRFADRPLTVHYYKPKHAGAGAALLFSLHGAERNGAQARDIWMRAADRHGAIVVAPELDYPRFSADAYQLGGMQSRDPSDWTFQLIEQLFDAIRREEGLQTSRYLMFGHSAGAQFVHRFVLALDHTRVSTAVAANAGAYMVPAWPAAPSAPRYPWALDERLFDRHKLEAVFGRRLVVLLGEEDTDAGDDALPRSREAMALGQHRFERGRNFYAAAQAQARALGLRFNWRIATVPGVGHNAAKMGKAAEAVLFAD
ncbi:MAG TPA: hypothetical protein VEC01_05300 [Noviherbaspirillum sp.]|uniref:hypothetical protein n=1 Tax=Noviherbaspirillum sp. TaxID=1926288 RepID=UPI002D6194A7|nr:hypothetical protein [Noviherbaspirillum sp.]HYD94722.1 hypothetical protein [Noviherbaspirillum sp.]